jgi:molybdopterin adenylyltransferase
VIRVAILVVSSKIASGTEEDKGKKTLMALVESIPATLESYEVVPDERSAVRQRLMDLADRAGVDLVLTVGGTGVRPADEVPEITRELADKEIPGMGDAMRMESLKKLQTAMLSRGIVAVRRKSLIVNLPGSPRGAEENFKVLLPVLEHTIDKIQGR